MIEWKKYDAFKYETPHVDCLITDGINIAIGKHSGIVYQDGWFSDYGTWITDSDKLYCYDVTHYAEINLPK